MEKEPQIPNSNNSKNVVGLIIIIVGILLLVKNLNFGFIIPGYIFSWQVILIIIGLVIGAKSNYQNKSSIILILIGGISLLTKILNDDVYSNINFPLIIIGVGIYLILKKRNKNPLNYFPNEPSDNVQQPNAENETEQPSQENPTENSTENAPDVPYIPNPYDPRDKEYFLNGGNDSRYQQRNYEKSFEDVLNLNTIFGNSRKSILSKKFMGGNMTVIFGSAELDLTHANIDRPVVIDGLQLFGSVKIIIPKDWTLYTNVATVFGEVNDLRPDGVIVTDQNKKIYIIGTCILGNLKIKNV